MGDDFFSQSHCDRCFGDLMVRTASWFNRDTICATCSQWEEKIIEERGESKSELEGIGSVPEVSFEVKWGEETDDM